MSGRTLKSMMSTCFRYKSESTCALCKSRNWINFLDHLAYTHANSGALTVKAQSQTLTREIAIIRTDSTTLLFRNRPRPTAELPRRITLSRAMQEGYLRYRGLVQSDTVIMIPHDSPTPSTAQATPSSLIHQLHYQATKPPIHPLRLQRLLYHPLEVGDVRIVHVNDILTH
jgi:hypothetical protein